MSQLSLLYIYIYIERERVVGLTVQQTIILFNLYFLFSANYKTQHYIFIYLKFNENNRINRF